LPTARFNSPFQSRRENSIVRIFQLLSDDDLKLLDAGISQRHIRYVLGAPRPFNPGNFIKNPGLKESADMAIYRELEGLRRLFAKDVPAYNPFVELRLGLEPPKSEWAEQISISLELLAVGLAREQDIGELEQGIFRFLKECRVAFDSDWQRQARVFLLLHEVAMRLEAEDLWRSKDRASFGRQDHVESILTNHLKKLSSFGIIARFRKPRDQGKSGGRHRFIPGGKVWRDPHHLIKMRKTLLTTAQDDIGIHEGYAIFGVSRLKSLPVDFGNMMIRDLDDYVRQIRGTWLKDFRENKNLVRERLEGELLKALRGYNAALDKRRKKGRNRKEIEAAFKNVERIWNLGAESSGNAVPRLPLVLLDLGELA
jgi:hypothetical protein